MTWIKAHTESQIIMDSIISLYFETMLSIILFITLRRQQPESFFQSTQEMVSSHYLKVLGLGEGKEVKNPFTISHYKTATNKL